MKSLCSPLSALAARELRNSMNAPPPTQAPSLQLRLWLQLPSHACVTLAGRRRVSDKSTKPGRAPPARESGRPYWPACHPREPWLRRPLSSHPASGRAARPSAKACVSAAVAVARGTSCQKTRKPFGRRARAHSLSATVRAPPATWPWPFPVTCASRGDGLACLGFKK